MRRQSLYILVAIALVFFLFYERPHDLLSVDLPAPDRISVALYRVTPNGQTLLASKSVGGSAARRLSGVVHSLSAVSYSKTSCHASAVGKILYTLRFRYQNRGTRIVQENACGEWIAGSRLWKPSERLTQNLQVLLPRPGG